MPGRPPPPALPRDYVQRTRALPANLLFLMPWLLVYQLALFFTRSPVDNAAAAWVRALFAGLGRDAAILVTLAVALALGLAVLVRVREAARDGGLFGGMLFEAVCYGALLGTAAGVLATVLPMERLAALLPPPSGDGLPLARMRLGVREVGLALGAGIFEELVFRGGLLWGVHALLRHAVGLDRVTSLVLALLVSAYVFSDYHHWGVTGEPYDPRVFAFRFHAGILLGVVFHARGLGIAALAHGLYDVFVLLAR